MPERMPPIPKKGLTVLGALAAALTLGNASGNSAAQAPAAPVDDATEVVGTTDDRNNRMTVPVSIGERGPFKFLIDTGAQATVITDRLNNTLQLEPSGTAMIVGMASRQRAQTVELEELSLGERTFYDLTTPILSASNVGADGIIGLDSLQGLRVLINFREESMTVADAEERHSNSGYEIVVRARRKLGQLIITNAIVDGVKAAVIIDTGAQGSMGNLALQKRIRSRRAATKVTSTDVNGVDIEGDLSVARNVHLGDLTLENIPIAYADTPAFDALGLGKKPALTLGMRHLRMFDRVAIDFRKRQILFDLPRGSRRKNSDQRNFPPGWF